jgi:hypothetical protein
MPTVIPTADKATIDSPVRSDGIVTASAAEGTTTIITNARTETKLVIAAATSSGERAPSTSGLAVAVGSDILLLHRISAARIPLGRWPKPTSSPMDPEPSYFEGKGEGQSQRIRRKTR